MIYKPRYKEGDRIGGRYRVHQALLGGMGEIYLCLDEETNYPYALKTFQGSDLRMKALFEEEVANWIALERHLNIVRLFHMETLDNIPFMFLEWIASDESRGTDLRSWIRPGQALELELALRFTIDICCGLKHANEKVPGIVHRDLKPDNVLVNQSRQAKITDFGLATIVQQSDMELEAAQEDDSSLGQSMRVGNVVGTPAYMPPEQWRGETDLDFRTDLYAVGCILYELLTSKRLYNGRTIRELKAQHIEAPLPALNGDFPLEVEQILEGCLGKEREKRFGNLNTLIAELNLVYKLQTGEVISEASAEEFTAVDYSNRGLTYNNLGEHKHAIADFDEAIRLDPNYAQAYNNRAGYYDRYQGEYERAVADYDEAIRLDPNFAQAYSNRGLSYNNSGSHERAIADYDEAIRLDPNFAQAYSNRGNSYNNSGSHERAIADYDEAIRLNPNNANDYYNRGLSYTALGDYKRAIADFDETIRLDPNYVLAYNNRGNRYAKMGEHKRAIADYDEAIRLDPNNALTYNNRGRNYTDLGEHQRAIADYDESLRLDPNFPMAYNNRGESYSNLGQHERAIKDFDHAIRLNPSFVLAYNNRGSSYMDLGEYERAIADYDEAIRLDPNEATIYLNKGSALGNKGRLQEALPYFEKAVELGDKRGVPYAAQVRQILGIAPTQANPNDLQVAFEAFQHANSLDTIRQAVQQYPVITQMIPTIEQVINEQVPAEHRPAFEQRLAWLKQIIAEGDQS